MAGVAAGHHRRGRPCDRRPCRARRGGRQFPDDDTDQTHCRNLRREHHLRPLFRHVSKRRKSTGRIEIQRQRRHPSVNGLTGGLFTENPNGTNAARLDRSQAITCSNNHSYTPEQAAVHAGLLDNFVATSCDGTSINLDYFDGNTVTAPWNYAQYFAMNENSFDTTFGPLTVGAINLISGQTDAIGTLLTQDDANHDLPGDVLLSVNTINGDPDPIFDDCGAPDWAGFAPNGSADNHNVGDLLNAKGVTWGWFQGGFAPTATVNGVAQCNATTTSRHPRKPDGPDSRSDPGLCGPSQSVHVLPAHGQFAPLAAEFNRECWEDRSSAAPVRPESVHRCAK